MNQLDKLFIPLENGDVTINKVELLTHKLLKPVIAKTKTKDVVDKIMYIYLMADVGSMYNHLAPEDKFKAVKDHFGYDDLWKPTPDMEIAVKAYEKLMELSATGRAYKTAVRAVYETGKDLDRLLQMVIMLKGVLETRINNVQNNNAFSESEKFDNIKEARAYIQEITTTQKDIIKHVKELPDLLKTVETLATRFAQENSTKQEIHGGGDLGNRE